MTQAKPKPWRMPRGYLSSALYDNTLIFGVMILAIGTGLIVNYRPELFVPVLLADLWFLGYHHVIATFTKLAGTKEDRKENRFLIYVLPFIVLSAVYVLFHFFGIVMIVTIYFFWQWFHYTRQSYGISSFYRRKAGVTKTTTPAQLDYAVIWAVPILGVLNRSAQGWDTFLFQPVWLPELSVWTPMLGSVIALVIVVYWLVTKFVDYSKGNLAYGSFFFVLSHQIVFFTAYVFIDEITIGWLVANIWHNGQYILFVWLFNRNRFQKPEMQEKKSVLHWLSQKSPYRTFIYFIACLGVTTAVYSSISLGTKWISAGDTVMITAITVVMYQTINFHHYIVDSLIWKARKKQHQKIMNIS